MADDDSLKAALLRLVAGNATDAELEMVQRALQNNQITLATNERAVAVGGNVSDTVIVTGDGNVVLVISGQQADRLRSVIEQTRHVSMVPDLPPHFVERAAPLTEIKSRLLGADHRNPVAITTALQGAGGFGKTTLAAALCHDADVLSAFDDGILWVTLGESPNMVDALTKLYRALTDRLPGFVDVEEAAIRLTEALADRQYLIVIDDVWNIAHLRPFLRGGGRCVRLITTRDAGITVNAHAQTVPVDEMTGSESVALLASGIDGLDSNDLRKLAARLGEWALMLELANAMMRERIAVAGDLPEAVLDWLNHLLDKRGVRGIKRDDKDARQSGAEGVLASSFELLKSVEQELLEMLSVFREDTDVPLSSVGVLWRLDEFDTEDIVFKFARLSLLRYSRSTRTIRLHGVIREILGTLAQDARAVHVRLIDNYGDLTALPDDYAWRHIAYHLRSAEKSDRLQELLLNYRYLYNKLRATDMSALIDDLSTLKGVEELELLDQALRLSVSALEKDSAQLPGQLVGRLLTAATRYPRIDDLLSEARRAYSAFGILPTQSLLIEAGGPLQMLISDHEGGVWDVKTGAFGHYITTLSSLPYPWPGLPTLKLWDSTNARLLYETGGVLSAVLSGDENTLLIGGEGSIRVLDLASLQITRTLGLASEPESLDISHDGTRALSGEKHSVTIWDLTSGTALHTIPVHGSSVQKTLMTDDGETIFIYAYHLPTPQMSVWHVQPLLCIASFEMPYIDNAEKCIAIDAQGMRLVYAKDRPDTVVVCDAMSGSIIRTIEKNKPHVSCIDVSADGNTAVTGHNEGEIIVWDLSNGQRKGALPNQEHERVNAVGVVGNGEGIISVQSKELRVWRTHHNQLSLKQEGEGIMVSRIALSADDALAITTDRDRIHIWSIQDGRLLQTFEGRGDMNYEDVAITPDNRFIILTASIGFFNEPSLLRIVDAETGWVYAEKADCNAKWIMPLAREDTVLLLSPNGMLRRCKIPSLEIESETSLAVGAVSAAVCDGENIWIASNKANALYGVDLAQKQVFMSIDPLGIFNSEVFDGVDPIELGAFTITALTITTDQRYIVAAVREILWYDSEFDEMGDQYVLKVWDVVNSKLVATMPGHERWIFGLCALADPHRIVSVSEDGTIKVWDLETFTVTATLTTDAGLERCQTLSDGWRVAVAGLYTPISVVKICS